MEHKNKLALILGTRILIVENVVVLELPADRRFYYAQFPRQLLFRA